ncbi:zinc finger protein 292a [Colossoma macropomum]|uniref:zinc finger protein 292a n=1 Tax=Colossoma macropomum TaxID=42526 RepID=UPI001865434E|nr:zinc finger protein 292a [Colossoma macropomum]
MAEEEAAERERGTRGETAALRKRFNDLTAALRDSAESPLDASASFCQEFCQILVEYGGQWKSEEDPLPLLEMYTVAILCFAEATPSLFPECEHVTVVLEKLALTCLDLLLSHSEKVPGALWEEFQSSVKVAHGILGANGNFQLSTLMVLAEESGVWNNSTLCSLLSNSMPDAEKVREFLTREGPTLLDMRIKHLIKQKCVEKAAVLAKTCAEFPEFGGKKNFKQIYLVCLCETMPQQEFMQEIKEMDCKDALDMICNLESEENEKGALSLCTAFLKRQLLQGDVYCAWELTLFWSKLLIRLESAQAFLDQCRLLAQLSGSVYHILLLIKVIQAEVQNEGLPVCIEMCIQALKMGVSGTEDCSTTICKTISCLLPLDLEVKRACQLTEFLAKPTVDSYYAVETLFNEPDQKMEEESLPIPNSLRCDLLLALKTQWPFDPEFWDWKTLKRHCLALMGEEASIVSSIDKLNDSEDNEGLLDSEDRDFKHLDFLLGPADEFRDLEAERKKKRDMKKLRERGFVSARFRNWQAYMQYCVLCDKEFLGHRIVKHALKHVQDGIFRCPICANAFETRAILEPHVASHVKQSCKERLAAMNAKQKHPSESILGNSKQDRIRPVKVELNMYPNFAGSSNTISNPAGKVKSKIYSPKPGNPVRDVENTEDCSCPVTSCQKVFKYFRNLVAHVKAHKNEEEATHFLEIQSQRAICQYCRRQFVNVTHLNDHLQMHCGEKPYFCIQLGCKCSFHSHAELLMHRKVHTEFQAQCMFPNCGRTFNEAYLLYDHEAQHYITFTCKNSSCGKVFYSLSQLNLHQKDHTKQGDTDSDDSKLQGEVPDQVSFNLDCSSNQVEVQNDSTPVRVQQSVEGMLNSIHDSVKEPERSFSFTAESSVTHDQSPAKDPSVAHSDEKTQTPKTACVKQSGVDGAAQFHLVPCHVKLEPIRIKYDDPIFLKALRSSDSVAQSLFQDKKLFSFTWKPHKSPQKTSNLHNQAKTNAGAESGSQNTLANGEDGLIHACPFETCTRRYSTTKSLSRHVKNVHFDAFEEWKLSRKYKRIAEIAAKKSDHKNTSFQTPKKKIKPSNTAKPQQYPETSQVKFPDSMTTDPFSSPSGTNNAQSLGAKLCSEFENSQSEAPLTQSTLMQSQMSHSWTSNSFDGYNSDYSLQNHFPSMIIPDSLQNYPLYVPNTDLLSEREMDFTPSLTDDGSTPTAVNTDSHSSVLNEASKYVSSSLRVLHALNGDQTCEMAQGSSSEDLGYMEMRQNHHNVIPPNVSDLHSVSEQNFNPYFSSYPAETCPSSVQPLDKTDKEFTVNHTDPLFSSDIKNIVDLASPLPVCKEEPESFSVSSVDTAALQNEQNPDLLAQEMSPVPTEGISPEDMSVTSADESKKAKKIRSSKRTKWPAIIKDGKVICCRCYREFSSTKSLGGHLSKRSQCRPIDEVDLTADLPTSFLDFLNDPDISTIQTSLTRNDMQGQHSESDVLNSDNFADIHSPHYSVQNGDLSSADTYKMTFMAPPGQSGSSSNRPSLIDLTTGPETGTERNSEAEMLPTAFGEDGKILEIERALQRLDLVDVLTQDTLKVGTTALQDTLNVGTTALPNLMPEAEIAKKRSIETKSQGDTDRKNILKPFRCSEEGCIYGAMTKEALFKHLSRVHDFTEDMINELKKNPDKLSPYTCHLCSKTFTRTTGLKIHYKNVHHLSKEELSRLKIGRERKKREESNSDLKDASNSLASSQTPCFSPVRITQSTSSAVFRVADPAATGKEMADLTKEKQCPKLEHVTERQSCMAANVPQKNSGFGLIPEKAEKSLQIPYHTGDNPSVQFASSDAKQELLAGNSVPPGRPSDLEQAAKATSTLVGEFLAEKRETPKKKKSKGKVESLQRIKIEKRLQEDADLNERSDDISLYRPYRCVHEGCVAAFSIQQNLILHYRAMHQSESAGEANKEKGNGGNKAEGAVQVHEFKCQVKECSKVVSKVTSLLKHYLLLHRCTLEKASALLSGVEVGTFQCDQSKCPAYFTCHLKYIDHIKNDHKAIRVSADGDFESVDLTFKCECEGCDRVYTTKSNLLRHLMKKHHATFETIKQKQKNGEGENGPTKTLGANPNNGKENIASNKMKLKKKMSKKKEEKGRNHWTSFGKPSLKSLEEASAMCTGKFPLQYPCMIVGCDAVLSAERHIFNHYTTHGLTERYIEDQRSHFIFCKKMSRLRLKDVNKSDDASAVTAEAEKAEPEEKIEENSLIRSQDPEPPKPEQPANENSSAAPVPQVKRKRGRPRKSEQMLKFNPERKQSLRNSAININRVAKLSRLTSKTVARQEAHAEGGVAQKLFSPSGLEASILKLFEESPSRNTFKRKASENARSGMPLKRQQLIRQRNARVGYKNSVVHKKRNIVRFRNPLKLESVNNVKIVVDESLSDGADLLLKQLQDMRPTVILKKWLCS